METCFAASSHLPRRSSRSFRQVSPAIRRVRVPIIHPHVSMVAARAEATASAVVIGCGPVGALAALHLARGGFQPVTVLEKRNASTQTESTTGVIKSRRSYSIVLNGRAQKALEEIPGLLERIRLNGVQVAGSLSYRSKRNGPSRQEPTGLIACDRQDLVSCIVEHTNTTSYAKSIDFRLGKRVVDVDFMRKEVMFVNSSEVNGDSATDSTTDCISYDLLVVAEGVYSSVRQTAVDRGHIAYQGIPDNKHFKIASFGRPENWQTPPSVHMPSQHFMTFAAHQPTISLLAPPRRSGDVEAIVVVDSSEFNDGGLLGDRESIRREFSTRFPQVFGSKNPITDNVIDEILAQKASVGGVTSVCSRFNITDSAVLIGDCASSCWPSLGQGANQGLEAVSVLAQCLFPALSKNEELTAEHTGASSSRPTAEQIGERLLTFSERRKPDADAVGELSMAGFGSNSRVMSKSFLLRVAALMLAHKVFGSAKPALFDMNNANIPYSSVLDAWEEQGRAYNMSLQIGLSSIALVVGALTMKSFIG